MPTCNFLRQGEACPSLLFTPAAPLESGDAQEKQTGVNIGLSKQDQYLHLSPIFAGDD